jgi:hypothetical protein
MWYIVTTMTWSVKECLPIMKASCVHFVPWESIASDVDSTRGNLHRMKFFFQISSDFCFLSFVFCYFFLCFCCPSLLLLLHPSYRCMGKRRTFNILVWALQWKVDNFVHWYPNLITASLVISWPFHCFVTCIETGFEDRYVSGRIILKLILPSKLTHAVTLLSRIGEVSGS